MGGGPKGGWGHVLFGMGSPPALAARPAATHPAASRQPNWLPKLQAGPPQARGVTACSQGCGTAWPGHLPSRQLATPAIALVSLGAHSISCASRNIPATPGPSSPAWALPGSSQEGLECPAQLHACGCCVPRDAIWLPGSMGSGFRHEDAAQPTLAPASGPMGEQPLPGYAVAADVPGAGISAGPRVPVTLAHKDPQLP